MAHASFNVDIITGSVHLVGFHVWDNTQRNRKSTQEAQQVTMLLGTELLIANTNFK